jgi:ubiquinone/menaquinone biosynthesis C-methylase UbiE
MKAIAPSSGHAKVGQALSPADPNRTECWQAGYPLGPPAPLFDSLAARYDALWTTTPIGRAQRDLVWRDMDPLFLPGQRILDIGCGTGEDAVHFAARGVAVYATDASPAMIQVAAARGGFAVAVRSAEELAQIDGPFDGAMSNFGALNCVQDLPGVARSLAALVRPGGSLAICILGRSCAWETLHYAVRFKFAKAFRRWRGRAPAQPSQPCGIRLRLVHPSEARTASSTGLTVYYPTVAEFRSAFAPNFQLRRWTGIGLLVPPSYVKLPATLVAVLAACDHLLARLPLLRALADHRLFLLVRTC